MSAARVFQRIEKNVAVQYESGNEEVAAVIRGWLGLGITEPLVLTEGAWIVKRNIDGHIYMVSDEAFKEDFVEVFDSLEASPDD